MKFKSHRSGFTLIELLVVISIISLLSSVILASVRDARDKAQQTAYREYLGQVVNSIELRTTSNSGNYSWIDSLNNNSITFSVNGSSSFVSVKFQKAPSFVSFPLPSDNVILILSKAGLDSGNFSCEKRKDEPYALYFYSVRNDLKFPKIYENDSILQEDDGRYVYCVSQTIR